MRTQSPVFGGLAVGFPLVGFVASLVATYYAERWAEMRLPFLSLLIGSVGGLLSAVIAFVRRERLVAIAVIGLVLSIAVGVFLFRLL
jgi:hypothetical protein